MEFCNATNIVDLSDMPVAKSKNKGAGHCDKHHFTSYLNENGVLPLVWRIL